MKKTIIKSAFVVACIAVAGYAAYHSQHDMELSELAMENVEALAGGESGLHIQCHSGSVGYAFLCKCGVCKWGYTGTSNRGTCY